MKLSNLEEKLLKEKFSDNVAYNKAIERLENGEPFAYVIGEWYFYDETYRVSPDCLIPRPETEHLVEWLIKNLPQNGAFLDLCTGSGCIAISTLAHRKDLTALAVDISEKALEIAKQNAVQNGVSDRISFIQADVLNADFLGDRKFDVIVSNPPYIRSDVIDTLSVQVKNEPRIALDGGSDGLDFYRAIAKNYAQALKPGGYLCFEFGMGQGDAVCAILEMNGYTILERTRDYNDRERAVIAQYGRKEDLYGNEKDSL